MPISQGKCKATRFSLQFTFQKVTSLQQIQGAQTLENQESMHDMITTQIYE